MNVQHKLPTILPGLHISGMQVHMRVLKWKMRGSALHKRAFCVHPCILHYKHHMSPLMSCPTSLTYARGAEIKRPQSASTHTSPCTYLMSAGGTNTFDLPLHFSLFTLFHSGNPPNIFSNEHCDWSCYHFYSSVILGWPTNTVFKHGQRERKNHILHSNNH